MSKRVLAAVLAAVLILGAMPALALFSSADFTWDLSGGVLTVDGTGTVPGFSEYTTRPWQSAASSITKVVIKGGVTAVGGNAFCHLDNLREVVIEEGVTSLGGDCFAYSAGDGAIDVTIPVSLVSLGQGVFYATNVNSVTYPDTSRDFGDRCSIGGYNDSLTNAVWVNDPDWGSFGDMSETVHWAFDADTGTLTVSGSGAIPKPTTKPWQSFISQIAEVVIGDGITKIPDGGLFASIPNLSRAELPETVTVIGGDAFAYNEALSYLRLSSNVTSIGQGVLYGTPVETISCKKDWSAIRQQASIGHYNENFANATWVDVLVQGSSLSFGSFGSGMENWTDGSEPEVTQLLICPTYNGVWDAGFKKACMNGLWTLTLTSGQSSVTTHLYPHTCYDGGDWGILRFVPALASDPGDRVAIAAGVEYTVTATFTCNGSTETVTSSDTFMLDGDSEPITFDVFHTVTWMIEGVTEYTEQIADGFRAVYHGAAADHTENGVFYTANVPEPAAITEDSVFNVTYTAVDPAAGTLGIWGDGYENTSQGSGTQTQLLLQCRDREGGELSAVAENTSAYTWLLTVNGVVYDVKPSSNYGATIFRFEPALWDTPLILTAGVYTISLEILDPANGNAAVFRSTEAATVTVADGFVPVHTHVPADGLFIWADDRGFASYAFTCVYCAGSAAEAAVTDNGDGTYTATAELPDGTSVSGVWPPYPAGDINGDRGVQISDVTALLDFLSTGDTAGVIVVMLDLDGDGGVQISDVTALLDLLSGTWTPQQKNGLYDEGGGVRFYENGEPKTGFRTYDGRTLYFDRMTGLMETENRSIDGTLYIFEPFTSGDRTLYAARAAKNGFYVEAGGVRFYTDDAMQTGFVTVGGYKLYFDPETGLMHDDVLSFDGEEYAAPEAVTHEGRVIYAYGDPVPVYVLPENGVLTLAPDGSAPGIRGGFNPSVKNRMLTVFFDFGGTAYGLDLADGLEISFTVTRGNGTTLTGSAPLDLSFDAIRNGNGYIGVRFDLEFDPDIFETIVFDLAFTDRSGKQLFVERASFTKSLEYMGLGVPAFAELAAKGIAVTVGEKTIALSGAVNGRNYALSVNLAKWAGNTSAAQVVTCAKLFFDVYPPMYERFGAAGGSPSSVELRIENEGYGIASAGGGSVHVHDMWLHNNRNDYDCLTHEFAHIIQNGWDGNYCEVSDYIEMFADCCRFIYATENGRYNDLGWSIGSPGSTSTYKNTVRFLVWMDYTYSTEGNDLLLKFFTACKNKKYRSSQWANAWTYIFKDSGLEGKTAAEAFEIFKNTEFATLSTLAPYGVSPLNAKYDVRAKAGRPAKVYALYFPLCNSQGVNSYAATWAATFAGQTWEFVNFSNGGSGWEYVKCGNAAGGSAFVRTSLPTEASSFVVDLGTLYKADVTRIALNVYNGQTPVLSLPLAIAEGRQVLEIPEEFRAAGLTYELEFVTAGGRTGAVTLEHIVVHTPGFAGEDGFDPEPVINTAAWAEYISETGSSRFYDDFELKNAGLYNVTHNGASNECPWENGDSPKQLRFLCNLGKQVFDLGLPGSSYPYVWTIWYKDADDPTDVFRPCVTAPISYYDFGGSILYRVPTYRDGMTDLHTDNGATNEYKFIIVFTNDATNALVCWAQLNVAVTDSYEMYLAELNG